MNSKLGNEKLIKEYFKGECTDAYKYFGSKPISDGIGFTLYAPAAEKVSVVGDFNNWSPESNPMTRDNNGVWHCVIEEATVGSLYKYAIYQKDGNVTYKSDPFALYNELRPGTASIIHPLTEYNWNDDVWQKEKYTNNPAIMPVNIYELHLGSWKKGADNKFLNYREIADLLVSYLMDMNYTHVDILPVSEHPYDGSAGLQTLGYYSVTSRYGTPEDFKYLIDRLHQAGIGVILDWCPGYFCKEQSGLYYFDGSWLYESEKEVLRENYYNGTACADLNKGHVRSFLLSNAVYFLQEFHADGLRVCGVSEMLYLDYGRMPDNQLKNMFGGSENLDGINFLRKLNDVINKKFRNTIMIAEESCNWPLVTKPTYIGGLGFTLKWNKAWSRESLEYASTDPLYKKWKHNRLTFSLINSFSDNCVLTISHNDVVQGKGSVINKMPGDIINKFGALKCFYLYMIGHPGKKSLFMGSEWGQLSDWQYYKEAEWNLLQIPAHNKLRKFVSQLNYYYKTLKPFWETDDGYHGFRWIDADNADQSILSFVRKGKEEKDFLIFICNFTPVKYHDYKIGVPRFCDYEEVINSDNEMFGGQGNINSSVIRPLPYGMHGMSASVSLTIPGNGGLILKPVFKDKPSRRSRVKTENQGIKKLLEIR